MVWLNWLCVCVNFDGYISWFDFVGKDVIVVCDDV